MFAQCGIIGHYLYECWLNFLLLQDAKPLTEIEKVFDSGSCTVGDRDYRIHGISALKGFVIISMAPLSIAYPGLSSKVDVISTTVSSTLHVYKCTLYSHIH